MIIKATKLLTYLKNSKVNIVIIKQPNEKPPPILDTYRKGTLKFAKLSSFEEGVIIIVLLVSLAPGP